MKVFLGVFVVALFMGSAAVEAEPYPWHEGILNRPATVTETAVRINPPPPRVRPHSRPQRLLRPHSPERLLRPHSLLRRLLNSLRPLRGFLPLLDLLRSFPVTVSQSDECLTITIRVETLPHFLWTVELPTGKPGAVQIL